MAVLRVSGHSNRKPLELGVIQELDRGVEVVYVAMQNDPVHTLIIYKKEQMFKCAREPKRIRFDSANGLRAGAKALIFDGWGQSDIKSSL